MASVDPTDSRTADSAVAYETRDVSIRGVFGFAAGLAIVCVLILLGLGWLFHYFAAREATLERPASPLAARQRGQLPPEPRLEGLEPGQAVRQQQASQEAALHSYGWVDREAGIVRIPIENAMSILVDHLPSAPPAAVDPLREQVQEEPSASNSGRIPRKGHP